MAGFISRGFGGRRSTPDGFEERLPPGQYYERGFPVLTAGPTPKIAAEEWGFTIDGMVGAPRSWTWDAFAELPSEEIPCDIHCVTKWSKLGTTFHGVPVEVLLDGTEPEGDYAMAYSYGGYTTNSRSPISWAAGDGWSPSTRVRRCLASTAAPPACSFLASTSGRAPNGSPDCA